MQALTMLGLSTEDVEKIEVLVKALSEMPVKLDGLSERVEKLEEAVKNGE